MVLQYMHAKRIIYLLIIIALAAGGYYYFQSSSNVSFKQAGEIQNATSAHAQANGDDVSPPEGVTAHAVDTTASTISWSASKVVGGGQRGTVALKRAELWLDQSSVLAGGWFVVDMHEIISGNDTLTAHLKSDDFFSVETYPESRFRITDIEPSVAVSDESALETSVEPNSGISERAQYEITGELTIKDTTSQISFPVSVQFSDEAIRAHAVFEIDRTRWGITYNSVRFFDDVADKAIKDTIGFVVDIAARTVAQE